MRGHQVADAFRVPVVQALVVFPELVEDAALGEGEGAAVLADVQGLGVADQGVVVDGFVGGYAQDGGVFSFERWGGHFLFGGFFDDFFFFEGGFWVREAGMV